MAKKGPSALAPSPISFLICNQNSSSLAPSPSKGVREPPESPSLLPSEGLPSAHYLVIRPYLRLKWEMFYKCSVEPSGPLLC